MAVGVAVAVGLSAARFPAPTHTLESLYSDHVHHEYAAWAFLHVGFKIFDTPLASWGDVHARYVHFLWPGSPMLYPLGLVLFFMPFGIASNVGLLSDSQTAGLMVMTLGAAAVLASYQLYRTLRQTYEPVLTGVLTFLGAVLFVTWGLDGFIDPLAAGLALAGIYWYRRELPGRALVALALALWLQYRLWYLWPLIIAIGIERRREIHRWQFGLTTFIAAISAVTFALSAPFLSHLDTVAGFHPNQLAVTQGFQIDRMTVEQGTAFAAAVLVIAVTLMTDRLEAAACVGLGFVLIFFVDQWQAWYPILFVPLLAVVRSRPAQIALTLTFIQVTLYLGAFPNLMRMVHLYVNAVG